MADESDLEKTEEATPRRLEKAREEGQVARSQELTTFALLMVAGGALWLLGSSFITNLMEILKRGLQIQPEALLDSTSLPVRLFQHAIDSLIASAPLFAVFVIVAAIAPTLLSGLLFTTKALMPDFKRLSPIQGFKRIFSMHGFVELVKAIVKTIVVGGVTALLIWYNKEAVIGLILLPIDLGAESMGSLLLLIFMLIAAAMVLIVGIDVPFQIWQHKHRLKMTKEEIRKESKEDEGDPFVKARIRSLQREAARQRMMAEVPKADVIVTNPTHYAVALKYHGESMRAPRVVAKGVHLLAQRIREIAEENRVPVLEVPPLTRALYHHTELNDEIPETLYTAVAQILAYVFQLKRYQTYGGVVPQLPSDLTVPQELDHA